MVKVVGGGVRDGKETQQQAACPHVVTDTNTIFLGSIAISSGAIVQPSINRRRAYLKKISLTVIFRVSEYVIFLKDRPPSRLKGFSLNSVFFFFGQLFSMLLLVACHMVCHWAHSSRLSALA